MGMPLGALLFDASSTPEARRLRNIENHYQLAMIAENTEQLVQFQADTLRFSAQSAALNVRAMGEIADRQDETNEHLADIVSGLDRVNDGLDALNATASATLGALETQTDVVRDGFAQIAERMVAQHATLLSIAKTLQRPYETQVLELRSQAYKWLDHGMRNTGEARDGDYADALHLLEEVVKNPIGNQDYVAWFQIGWLLWKRSAKPNPAEQAFYRAARLSAPDANHYHVLSVRHLAHMQYLQGRYEDAYQTVQCVVQAASDHDAPFDAARYAAKTGRKNVTSELLSTCIERVPTIIVTMFAEPDFGSCNSELLCLASSKLADAWNRVQWEVLRCRRISAAVAKAENIAQHRIQLPNELNHRARLRGACNLL